MDSSQPASTRIRDAQSGRGFINRHRPGSSTSRSVTRFGGTGTIRLRSTFILCRRCRRRPSKIGRLRARPAFPCDRHRANLTAMPYPTHLLPTTVVGTTPQPEWLVDKTALHKHGVPRTHVPDIWRIPEPFRTSAQDDATILAIRDMERAGIDIVTDGE